MLLVCAFSSLRHSVSFSQPLYSLTGRNDFQEIRGLDMLLISYIAINATTALLFAGPLKLDTLGRGLIVDDWLHIRGWARIGVLIGRLRAMLDDLLARKIEDPGLDVSNEEVVAVVRRLIEKDGLDN